MSHEDIKEIMERCVEEIKDKHVMQIKQEDPLQDDHLVQEHVRENNDNEDVLKYEDDLDIDDYGKLPELKHDEIDDHNNCDGSIEETEDLFNTGDSIREAQIPKYVKEEGKNSEDETSIIVKEEEEPYEYEIPQNEQFPKYELSDENDSEDEALKVVCPKCPKKLRNKQCLKSHVYDTHSGPKFCEPCQRTFKLRSEFTRHNKEVHMKIPSAVCSNCGKSFARTNNLRLHEAKCLDKTNGYVKRKVKLFGCQYCPRKYSSENGMVFHERKIHKDKDGNLIVTEKVSNEEENICKVCTIPRRFFNKSTLNRHMLRIHNGRNDVIKVPFSNKVIKLSENEVGIQESNKADCELCSEVFACEQDLHDHMKSIHNENKFYKCKQCPKKYSKLKKLRVHERSVHIEAKFVCPECGKKSKRKTLFLKHLEVHRKDKPDLHRKPFSSLKRSQRYKRLKAEANRDLNKSD